MIKNLSIKEVDNNGVVRRNGFWLGKFVSKEGIYHFVDSICNGSGKYYHSVNTGCKTLENAVSFISQ